MKINLSRASPLGRLAVYPRCFRPPLLDGGDSGIGKRRLAFQKVLPLDAAVLLHPHLELHETLQARPLRKRRIRWLGEIDEALLEIIGILSHAAPEFDFQTGEPAFQPVHLGVSAITPPRGSSG